MTVRALRGFAGPFGAVSEGDTFALPEGADWLDCGLVEAVEGEGAPPPAEPEAAAPAAEPGAADAPKPKKKGAPKAKPSTKRKKGGG